jgi:hypothetical protein
MFTCRFANEIKWNEWMIKKIFDKCKGHEFDDLQINYLTMCVQKQRKYLHSFV